MSVQIKTENGWVKVAGNASGGGTTESTLTRTTTPLDASADGNVKAIKLYGNSYKSGSEIIIPSGDVVTSNADKTETSTIHTDRPLLSVNDIRNELIIDKDGNGTFTERVILQNDELVVKDTPTTEALTQAEISTILSLKTFDGNTYIDTDGCPFEITYVTNQTVGSVYSDLKYYEQNGFLSRNVFSFDNATLLKRNNDYIIVDEKTLQIKQNSTSSNFVNVIIPIEKNTDYVANFEISSEVYAYGLSFIDEIPSSFVNNINNLKQGNSETHNYLCLGFQMNTGSGVGTVSDFYIEKGTELHGYTPYAPSNIDLQKQIDEIGEIYSEEEIVIGEFLGKTLYRKVIKLANPISTSTSGTNTGINVSYVDTFVKGLAIRTKEDSRGTGCVDLYLHKNGNILYVYSAPSSGGVSIIVMEYTKL